MPLSSDPMERFFSLESHAKSADRAGLTDRAADLRNRANRILADNPMWTTVGIDRLAKETP